MDNFKTIHDSTKEILECGNDIYKMKQCVDSLYLIFKNITSIDISKLNEGEIMLPKGKAISPSAAAHCLLEMKRTAIFLRGIKKAIDTQINKKNSKINILYAGCGPYATLVTPLLTLYSPQNIKISILDINQQSLQAVNSLMNELKFEEFIDSYILADASEYKTNQKYDIIISETMQSCLQNEPQVAIMQNLIPQMGENGIFIPEEISIDAYLRNPGIWNGTKAVGEEHKHLDKLFSVNKNNLEIEKFRNTINIPEEINSFIELMLHTTIKIYQNEILYTNDCSLNLPKKFYEFKKPYANQIKFWYDMVDFPHINSKIIEYAN